MRAVAHTSLWIAARQLQRNESGERQLSTSLLYNFKHTVSRGVSINTGTADGTFL